MENLTERLESLGFSPAEARVYLTLVREGTQTGYQVAKQLGVARSSVYAALDSLFRAGAVFLRDGDASEYSAKDPRILIAERKKAFRDNADRLEEELAAYRPGREGESYYNLTGIDALRDKARELLEGSRREVYMNTDFDLDGLADAVIGAAARGVRIVLFSFRDYGEPGLPLEFYHKPSRQPCTGNNRLMLVADRHDTLVGGGSPVGGYRGTFTAHPLMAEIVAEHIHLDIYLLRTERRLGRSVLDDNVLLGTEHETQHLPAGGKET